MCTATTTFIANFMKVPLPNVSVLHTARAMYLSSWLEIKLVYTYVLVEGYYLCGMFLSKINEKLH